jgi:DNA-binding transcriptional MerR regulator
VSIWSASRTAAKTAAAPGVTAKMLRVWEIHGFLQPERNAAGWRVYGQADFARIHQILALKGLGLGLAEIAGLLGGRLADLDAVLALQAKVLRRRRAEADKGLALISKARAQLKSGDAFSLDDFANLIRETTMNEKPSQTIWQDVVEPIAQRHCTSEEFELIRQMKMAFMERVDFDPGAFTKAWDVLIAEARTLMAEAQPTSPEAMDFARRWKAFAAQAMPAVAADPALRAKTHAIWDEAMADPQSAARMPITPDLLAFVSRRGRRQSGDPVRLAGDRRRQGAA